MPEPDATTRRPKNGRWIVAGIAAALLLLAAYAWSVDNYKRGLDGTFVAPVPPPDAVAVQLVPYNVDAAQQFTPTELAIHPGTDLVTPEGRLRRDIAVDVFGLRSTTVTFRRGEIPTPVSIDVPVPGVVQQYPFDSYTFNVQARTVQERPNGSRANPPPLPMSLFSFFKVPGWRYTSEVSADRYSTGTHIVKGTIARDGATITIAVIFLVLMVMFAALAVITIAAALRGRVELTIGTAAWLTGAVFALVSLRNGLPGNPPIGSWMDILVYFWVIAVIMLMIGASVISLVVRGRESQ